MIVNNVFVKLLSKKDIFIIYTIKNICNLIVNFLMSKFGCN